MYNITGFNFTNSTPEAVKFLTSEVNMFNWTKTKIAYSSKCYAMLITTADHYCIYSAVTFI